MATTQKQAEPIRKITVKTVTGLDKAEILEMCMKDKTKAIPLMKVAGVVTRIRPGESDFGNFVRFLGQFQAINLIDGSVYRSSVCLLPKFMEDELAGAIVPGATSKVEFAAQVNVKFDKDAATSYVYLSDSLLDPVENDDMKRLGSLIGVKLAPALPDKTKDNKK